jgi:hypothetical protein
MVTPLHVLVHAALRFAQSEHVRIVQGAPLFLKQFEPSLPSRQPSCVQLRSIRFPRVQPRPAPLIGDKGGRQSLLADFALMHQAPLVPHRD